MESLDFFFADITTPGSRNVLLADPKPFSFLVRKVKNEVVVLWLNQDLNTFQREKDQLCLCHILICGVQSKYSSIC